MSIIYDTAIIGTGPAGVSAAINLKIREKSIIWFGSKSMSSKIDKAAHIANYPGFSTVSGQELNDAFKEHINELGLTIVDKRVTNISNMGDKFMVLADNEIFEAKTVLLATGVVSSKGIEGEDAFLGRGVSYCATCDGMFYKGKTIAAYVEDDRAKDEIDYLAGVAKKVYLFTKERMSGKFADNVEAMEGRIKKISGKGRVEAIETVDGQELEADGIFIFREAISPSKLLPDLEMDGSHIVVNRKLETNISGCFAAGDNTGRPYQIAKAIGEGNVAAHEILGYLSRLVDGKFVVDLDGMVH